MWSLPGTGTQVRIGREGARAAALQMIRLLGICQPQSAYQLRRPNNELAAQTDAMKVGCNRPLRKDGRLSITRFRALHYFATLGLLVEVVSAGIPQLENRSHASGLNQKHWGSIGHP